MEASITLALDLVLQSVKYPQTDDIQALFTAICLMGTIHAEIICSHVKKYLLKLDLLKFRHQTFGAVKLGSTQANLCQINSTKKM